MRKFFLILLAGLVVAVANYYYQVHQINKAVEEISQQLAPFGHLEHAGASFSLSGEARINRLRFSPTGTQEAVLVRRVAITTGGLRNLLQLNSTIREGRLPSQLGISLRGVQFPLDGALIAAMEEEAFSLGLPFDAAGCDSRSVFNARDMARMGYFDFTGSINMDYHTVGDVDAISWSLDAVADGMSRFRIETGMELDARSNRFEDLMTAADSMYIGSIKMTFDDMGYYDRIMAFCAEQMDLPVDEYIEHHVDEWQQRWREEGMVAGPEMVTTYRQFLDDPGSLSIRVVPSGNVFELYAQGVDVSRLLGSLSLSLAVEDGSLERLDLRVASGEEREEAAAERQARSRARGDASDSVAEAEPEPSAPPSWQTIPLADLGPHENASVRITLHDGREREGRLKAVEDGRIVIERRMQGGYMEVPVRRSDIASVQIWR